MITLLSCGSENDPGPAKSRTITFEISGDFKGTIVASHTTAAGGTVTEEITLPWKQDITFAPNVNQAIIAIGGSGGSVGQSIVILIKQGGDEVSSTTVTADSRGAVSASAPVIFL